MYEKSGFKVATLSVILISFNEASRIDACLRKVAWADEIIVVDSCSTDDTRDIALQHTPHVHNVAWMGFGPQKNHALSLATCDWILSIDCDEQVSDLLASDIQNALKSSTCNGYTIPFRNRFLGRITRFGEWSGERKLRLFRKGRGQFTNVQLHERLEVVGEIQPLRGCIEHDTCPTEEHLQHKKLTYAAIGASNAIANGKRATLPMAAGRAFWSFLRSYVFKLGVFDGRTGWRLACCMGHSTWLKYRWIAAGSVPEKHQPRSK